MTLNLPCIELYFHMCTVGSEREAGLMEYLLNIRYYARNLNIPSFHCYTLNPYFIIFQTSDESSHANVVYTFWGSQSINKQINW